MNEIIKLEDIPKFCEFFGIKEYYTNPNSFTVINLENIQVDHKFSNRKFEFGFYFFSILKTKFKGVVNFGNQTHELFPQDIIFIPPNRATQLTFEEDYYTEGWSILMSHEFVSDSPLGTKLFNFPYFAYDKIGIISVPTNYMIKLEHIVSYICDELPINDNLNKKQIILSFINVIFDYLQDLTPQNAGSNTKQNSNYIYLKFIDIVNKYFKQDNESVGFLTLENAAKTLGVSVAKLRLEVKQSSGLKPLEIIHEQVITRAKYHLINTNKNISEISILLGYSNQSAFTKLFKTKTGQTPLEFKKKYEVINE
ncbi:MAG: helix-turn-helix domain-containing protein [Flavobacteriales bacterium]